MSWSTDKFPIPFVHSSSTNRMLEHYGELFRFIRKLILILHTLNGEDDARFSHVTFACLVFGAEPLAKSDHSARAAGVIQTK